MLVKMNQLDFTFARSERQSVEKQNKILTQADWVKFDRIVIAVLFIFAILGCLMF